ncbi:MAG: spondin domain-containing protein [Thermosynechococcaceae cyanobacterium]
MLSRKIFAAAILTTGALLTMTVGATAATLRVTVDNLGPVNGTFTTPLWFGVHDGSFDLFDVGSAASTPLERIAEDGNIAPLTAAFNGTAQGVVFGPNTPPIGPGETGSTTVEIDPDPSGSLYFSYAAMILPSNDAFIGNENARQFQLFDNNGNFTGADFVVPGALVWDAGTEVNDELETTTAFFNQATPDTGTPENGTVQLHPGFNPNGRILASDRFANADFTAPGYNVARIRIEQVPELGTEAVMLLGLVPLFCFWRRRLQKQSA